MNNIYTYVVIGSVVLFFWWIFGSQNNQWFGFYYPEGQLTAPIYSPEFKSKEECISWGENMIKSRPQDQGIHPQELYECGRDCKRMVEADPFSTRVCQQNFDGGDWRRGDYGE